MVFCGTSPNRDNGYDVTDHYGEHPKHGTPGDFVEFMNHARALGLRVIVDLVVNHTSTDHPWFQSARSDKQSPYREWCVWADERPDDHDTGMVFPGVQRTTWSFDDAAGRWYFHPCCASTCRRCSRSGHRWYRVGAADTTLNRAEL